MHLNYDLELPYKELIKKWSQFKDRLIMFDISEWMDGLKKDHWKHVSCLACILFKYKTCAFWYFPNMKIYLKDAALKLPSGLMRPGQCKPEFRKNDLPANL